jgi:hypothetical protein
MPTSTGKYLLDDFDLELTDAGFDAIGQARRYRWINFGYNRIASEFPWTWEKAIIPFTMTAGEYYAQLFGAGADIPNFRTIDHLYLTAPANLRTKLERLDNDDTFYDSWLVQDLTAASVRATPEWYRIEDQRMYILPPPPSTYSFEAHVHQRMNQLDKSTPGVSDNPLTPQWLDQAIMLATFCEGHKRVYELQLAAQAEADLGMWVDQMRIDDDWVETDQQERVEGDDTWA